MRRTQLLCFALVLALTTAAATADSISPASQTWPNATPGQTLTFQKEVTISASQGALIDVFFLFDVSGSMVGLVDQARASASQLINDLSTLYGGGLAVGVGYYTDVPVFPFGLPTGTAPGWEDTPWELTAPIGSLAAAQAALASLPNGGYAPPSLDVAEAQLYALKMASTEAGWTDGAARILIWVGDNPGWDATYPDPVSNQDFYPAAYATSVQEAIAALNAAGIIVEALSAGSTGLDGGWNAAPIGRPDITLGDFTPGQGQATDITTATGGNLLALGSDDLVQKILDAVQAGFEEYTSVGLDLSGAVAAGLLNVSYTQSNSPFQTDTPYTGTYSRSAEQTFLFDVTLTVPGGIDDVQYVFSIWGTLDQGQIVAELDRIIVGNPGGNQTNDVPEPTTLALMGLGLLGVGIAARRKMRR